MNHIIRIVLFLNIIVLISCKSKVAYTPDTYLDSTSQFNLKVDLARYLEKLPTNCNMDQRWDSTHVKYYSGKASKINLTALYTKDSIEYYFVCTRIVPSVNKGDRRAHIGRLIYRNNKIEDIEEYYWSNILSEEILTNNSEIFLNSIINNPNHTLDKDQLKLMEWPNDYFYYDKVNKSWSRRP